MSVAISIENVIKRFGKDTIINGLSLDVRPGEFFTLLGPSGCGKTTLLRMIIGFNSIEGGEIKIDGKVINNIPTNKRNMGMVFQNYAIFPHMSVRDNVAFGLKNRKVPQDQIESQVDEILKVVKIDHLKKRMPSKLSGGQQQRVALARALVIEPGGAAYGRTPVQPGRQAEGGDEKRHQADPAAGGHHHHICDP